MRMWNVPVELMCGKHLRGEHVETHMFLGTLNRGSSLQGYIDKGLFDLSKLQSRHDELAAEMKSRGDNHQSPLFVVPRLHPKWDQPSKIDTQENILELSRRCEHCYARIKAAGYELPFPRGGDGVVQLDGKWYPKVTGQVHTEKGYETKQEARVVMEYKRGLQVEFRKSQQKLKALRDTSLRIPKYLEARA